MAEKKLTKKDNLMVIRGIVENANRPDLVAFCDHEIELLNKKNASKGQSKVQKENEIIKDLIIQELTAIGNPVTVTELQNASEELAKYSNQKLTALLTQLTASNDVVRVADKKKTYFSIGK